MRKFMLASVALVALLAGSVAGVAAQGVAGPDGLVTETVEPGVERVIRDDAGHDLDEKHPMHRWDMVGIAIAPEGTVWLRTNYINQDTRLDAPSSFVWALGQPGMYTSVHAYAPTTGTTYLYTPPHGPKVVIEIEAMSSEDGSFIPDPTHEGLPGVRGKKTVLVARPDGDHTCRNTGKSVVCKDPAGATTTYLADTPINQIAAAPDGTLWVVAGYRGDRGGLYRITLE